MLASRLDWQPSLFILSMQVPTAPDRTSGRSETSRRLPVRAGGRAWARGWGEAGRAR